MPTQRIGRRSDASKRLFLGAMLLGAALAPAQARSQTGAGQEELVRSELLMMGKRGEVIARARESVLEILQTENGCSQWFEEADQNVAAILISTHYRIEEKGPLFIYRMADASGEHWLKHPWTARTTENGGRGSEIFLNANGSFFNENSTVRDVSATGSVVGSGGWQRLTVGSYCGNTLEARMATLLHELGHIVGRLPDDDDSRDGRSSENSWEVLRHCKREIRAVVRRKLTQR